VRTATPATEAEAAELLDSVLAVGSSPTLPEDYWQFVPRWREVLRLRTQVREFTAAREQDRALLAEIELSNQVLEEKYQGIIAVLGTLERQKTLLEEQRQLLRAQLEALTAIEQQLVEQESVDRDSVP
jgi:hypothetical protein